jgi:hypothetical protein
MADVAGDIKYDQAYHLLNKGSTITFAFRYNFLLIMLAFVQTSTGLIPFTDWG